MVDLQAPLQAEDDAHLWPESLFVCNMTLATPAENLTLDEALLSRVEADPTAAFLRFWQPQSYFVVLGRSNRTETEVDIATCEREQIPIFRRSSGGGTVLVGPGCLCYSLILPLQELHRSLGISKVTAKLMERTAAGLKSLLTDVNVCGTSDLVWSDRKFSGNAQRWLRGSFIHHGTLLYDFDLAMIGRCLRQPSRQPDYRQSRDHHDFVTNVPLSAEQLKQSLVSSWNGRPHDLPAVLVDQARQAAKLRKD